MFDHAPKDYVCPICLGVKGVENENTLIRKQETTVEERLVFVEKLRKDADEQS